MEWDIYIPRSSGSSFIIWSPWGVAVLKLKKYSMFSEREGYRPYSWTFGPFRFTWNPLKEIEP